MEPNYKNRDAETADEAFMNQQTGVKPKLEIIVPLVEMLINLQQQMDRIVDFKIKYQRMLYEPQLLFRSRKDCLALLTGLGLYNYILTTGNFSRESVGGFIESLQRQDKDFAREIENLLPKSGKRKSLFSGLVAAIWTSKREGINYLISYISTHMEDLLAESKLVENRRASAEIRRLLAIISGKELQWLEEYGKDCDNWINIHYKTGSNMAVLKRRIELFLRGGYDGRVLFMGLLHDFGDSELAKKVLGNEKIRNLWRYEEQVAYLNSLIEMCRKSETPEGLEEWKGFFGKDGFWGTEDDEKGKNFDRHANEFLTKFGNKDFRDTLMAYKFKTDANPNGIGQSPEGWGGVWQGNRLVKPGFLHLLLRSLQDPTYQRQKIIAPAAEELKRLFNERAAEARKQREKSIDDLTAIINKIKGAEMDYKAVLARLKNVLMRKKRIMFNNLLEDSKELTPKMKEPMEVYDAYSMELDNDTTMRRIDFRNMLKIAWKWKEAGEANARFLVRAADPRYMTRNLKSLGRAMNADTFVKTALAQIDTMLIFEHISDEEIAKMQNWIVRSQSIIEKLNLLYEYVNSKIASKYSIKPEDFERLDIRAIKIKNPEFNFSYVKKATNKLVASYKVSTFSSLRLRAAR